MVYPYNNIAEQLHWLFRIHFINMGKCSRFENGKSSVLHYPCSRRASDYKLWSQRPEADFWLRCLKALLLWAGHSPIPVFHINISGMMTLTSQGYGQI